ncbi:hypothetical protein [Methylobrevis albus]|uniref:Uncharacterized protein n=1 Tax=Methylobrevis albus TaxID=2793297 RepID=A0A931I0Q9_9HYPH|nr:hypothetical protein [Methylobrevis albus]MBH0238202.1 hypothetical protein [Methylobrevis albus]
MSAISISRKPGSTIELDNKNQAYIYSYPIVLSAMAKTKSGNFDDIRNEIRVVKSFVYLWMGRNQGGIGFNDISSEFINSTIRLCNLDEIENKSVPQLKSIIDIIFRGFNGLGIPSSKYLHFICPEVFPMWDTNIGNLTGCAEKYHQFQNTKNYIKYIDYINENVFICDNTRELILSINNGLYISEVRTKELALFLQKKNGDKFILG